jgi:UDPglucose--hexose-1-phosphate uridylyltransferase
MASAIRFKIVEQENTFLDPRANFQQITEKLQVRIDPLTDRTGHVAHFGAIKPQRLPLESYARPEVIGFCPFCPEARERATPKFPENVVPGGRTARNEAVLIPNLYPYDVFSGVVIMADRHVVPLDGFTENRLTDTFSLGIDFLRRITSFVGSPRYPLMAWNYMPPSGGGLVHPHQQCFATEYPGNQYMDELRASEQFHHSRGQNYWAQLVEAEREIGERYIGKLGSSHWLSSFVPLGILGEIMCVFPSVYSIEDFDESHIHDLVTGLLKAFRYYAASDIHSFNASLFFGPPGQRYFSTYFRAVPRTFLNMRDYAPDPNFYQMLLSEPVCVVIPEKLCEEIRPYFG